jgi:hypothetical protein
MKNSIFVVVLAAVITLGSNIQLRAQQSASPAGRYGVCAWEGEESHAVSFELTLNTDNTFLYVDNTDKTNKISVSGKWTLFEGDVFLSDYPSGVRIMKIWKSEKNQTVLKARKGTAYYRLCRIGEVVAR